MDELPDKIKALVEKGYSSIGKDVPHDRNEEFERLRILARKWRNLLGEAKFDIPQCLHQYLDWNMPKEWEAYRKPSKIKHHQFDIKVPGLCPVAVVYKQFAMSADWFFHEFEILTSHNSDQRVHSTRYHDLPLFLAIARELHKPRRQVVTCEEIGGGIQDNARLIKACDIRKNKNITGYILTEADFLNNPGYDSASDDGMATYP